MLNEVSRKSRLFSDMNLLQEIIGWLGLIDVGCDQQDNEADNEKGVKQKKPSVKGYFVIPMGLFSNHFVENLRNLATI